MLPAPNARISLILAITFSAAALALPSSVRAAAGAPQICTVGTTCVIGEYLYDDNYTPITTADICTLNAKDPDEVDYILAQDMPPSAEGDGFYFHEFTAPATEGYYRAEVCCAPDGETLCLDKSFEVRAESSAPSTVDIADEVWTYSGRTLDNFGTLVNDIWNNTSRTLSSFGGLVSSIWSNDSRSLTSSSASVGDVSDIRATVRQNRLLLEQLVNKPIIENFIEEETVDLSTKLKDTKTIASQLYANNQYIASKASLIASRWYGLSDKQLIEAVDELSTLLGEEGDSSSNNSVFGQVNWLKKSWDWDTLDSLQTQTKSIAGSIDSVSRQLGSYGKTKTAYTEIRNLATKTSALSKMVGATGDGSSARTVFGKLREVEDLAQVLNSRSQEADKVLAGWKDNTKKKNISTLIGDLVKKVLAINRVPKARSVFASIDKSKSPETQLKNQVLVAKAVITANELLLARGSGRPLASTWLEEGSIVFKSLVTNPSKLISQDVPLKYYLPPEVTKESIVSTSDGLTVEYDAEKGQYYVEGFYKLGPGESLTLSVTVDDGLWDITDDELASLYKQAEELARPLEKTSFFAQGVTLKSDIDASLDKAKGLRDAAVTPEQKIRAYREANIEINSAQEKLDKLQELVTQAGATGTLFGFVGGAQTLAVWGLIIIMAAGFVFLALYMRTLGVNSTAKEKIQKGKGKKNGKTNGEMFEAPKKKRRWGKVIQIALPLVIVAVVSGTISALIARSVILSSIEKQEEASSAIPEVLSQETDAAPEEDLGLGGEDVVRVVVPAGGTVNVRTGPSLSDEIIMRLETSQEVTRIGEDAEWVNIAIETSDPLENATEGWVNKKYVEEPLVEEPLLDESSEPQTLTVKDTPTGFLRVRSTPSTQGEELGKVNPGDSFSVMDSASGWFQIEMPDGVTGWVSGTYASVE
jgi:uncharacterized protein YgiM (DUF1202 family)